MQMHFKNRFKVYLKYTSLLNSWWAQSIYLKDTKLNYFSVSQTLEIKISPKVHLKYTSYLACRSIRSIAQLQQDKILIKVYIHYSWRNGQVVSVQVYQTKNPRFKITRCFYPSKVNLMNIKDSWGLGC